MAENVNAPVPEEMTREDGQRTFAILNYRTIPAWCGLVAMTFLVRAPPWTTEAGRVAAWLGA